MPKRDNHTEAGNIGQHFGDATSIEQLKPIIDGVNSGVSIVVYDSDGKMRLVYANDRYYDLFGYTKEQFITELRDSHETVYPEDRAYVGSMMAEVKRSRQAASFRYRAVKRDGSIMHLNCSSSVSSLGNAGDFVLLSILTDTSETAEKEQKITITEQRLEAILQNINNAVSSCLLHEDGSVDYLFVSDRFYEILGFTQEQYASEVSDPFALFHPDDVDAVRNSIVGLKNIGDAVSLQYRIIRRDGGLRWINADISLMRFADADEPVQVSVYTDITATVEAEEKLRISEEMLRIAAETDARTLIAYYVKDNVCRVESHGLYSAKYGETLGNVPGSLIELGIVAEDSAAELASLFERIRQGEKKISTALQLRTGSSEYQWFECNAGVVCDTDGKPERAVLVFHNITEQRIKEAVFKKWQQSIEVRAPESYTLFRCNLSRDASLDQVDGMLLNVQFSANAMSFNQRTEEYASQQVCPDDREAYCALLNSDTLLAAFYQGNHYDELEYREMDENGDPHWRLLTIELVEYPHSNDVQAFLMYEDIDEKKKAELAEKEMAEIDPLTGVLNRVAFAERIDALIKQEASAQHAFLMVDMDGFKRLNDTFGHAVGDQTLQEVSAILRSLMREGDLIGRLSGDVFLIWLRGVPYDAVINKMAKQMCEQTRKAFNQAVQVSASIGAAVYPRDGHDFEELYHSADIALSKVKQSGKDGFAFFSASALSAADDEKTKQPAAPITSAKIKRRMLIADDHEMNLLILEKLFKDEYIIEKAKNGAEAMIKLRHFTSAISIVLLDLVMPKMDGFEVLKKMQSSIELRSIPVIVVSADDDIRTPLRAIEIGAADYVSKPIEPDLIRMRVKSVVSKADNENLRAQNSYLQLQREEEVKYHTVLDSTGTVVVEYDWHNHVFIYDANIGKYIAGDFNNRNLWNVFLSDMVADSSDVKQLQDMLRALASDHEQHSDSRLALLRTPNNKKHWFRINAYKQVNAFGLAEKMIITFNDVNDDILANEKLRYQATRDELTGLYNRVGFIERAAEMIGAKEPGYYVLSHLNIDHFKVINDQYGSEVGDKILDELARRLLETGSTKDVAAARITGDKFAILYPSAIMNSELIDFLHNKVIRSDIINQPVTIRIGRYVVDDKTLPVSAMYDRAILAERSIQGRYDVFVAEYDDAMRDQLLYEQQIVTNMEHALNDGEFEPFFQPQYNHATGALIGAEVLVRWHDPRAGIIVPTFRFIQVFERNGFIYELDKYIWEQTCLCLRKWIDAGEQTVPVSVNISRMDVFHDDFFDTITGLVQKYSIPVDLLRLEITESAFSDTSAKIINTVKALIDFGFTMEIDDFGSGYSSLNTLKDVPAQILKLDMKFFENSGNTERGGSIVESVVRMAKWLGMAVIAEGVEDKAQADYLKSIGCYYIQGYLYAKPMPLDAFEQVLAKNKKEPELARLVTVEELDNNKFWDPESMDTLIFNSYVGGACIFEYHDGVTELMRANERYARTLGCFAPQDGVLGVTILPKYLHGKYVQIHDDMLAAAIRSRQEESCEVKLTDPDAPEKYEYIRLTVRAIAAVGNRYLFYCRSHNVTAQRIAEKQAKRSAQQLAVIMGSMNAGVIAFQVTEKGTKHFIFSNKQFFEMFGYDGETMSVDTSDPFRQVHPDDLERVNAVIRQVASDHLPITIEFRGIRPDGAITIVRAGVATARLADVEGDVIIANISDITLEKELELQLKFSSDTSHSLLAVADTNSSIESSLEKTREYFGAERAYIIEVDRAANNAKCTFEVCAEGIKAELENAQSFPLDLYADWVDAFGKQGYVHIEDTDALDDSLPEKAVMKAQGIRSLLAVPIIQGETLFGFIGVDDPTEHRTHIKQLLTAGDHIGAVLGRSYLGDRLHATVQELKLAEQKERESAAQLQTVMSNINGGVSAVTLKDGKVTFLYCNDLYYGLFGYTKQQAEEEHLDVLSLVVPEDYEATIARIEQMKRDRQPAIINYRCRTRDGKMVYIQLNASLTSMGGHDDVITSVVTDVTEQKRLADQLQAVIDNIYGGVVITTQKNEALRFYLANDRYYNMYGYTREQYNAEVTDSYDLIVEEDRERIRQQYAESIQTGKPFSMEYSATCRDGSIVRTQNNITMIQLFGLDAPAQLSVLNDVTNIYEARRKEQDVAEQMRAIMQNINGGITAAVVKDDGAVELLFANDGYYESFGYTREQFNTEINDAMDLVYPDDRQKTMDRVAQMLRERGSATYEYRCIKRDGSIIWIQCRNSVISLNNVGGTVLLAVTTDITELREAEQKQRTLATQLQTVMDNIKGGVTTSILKDDGDIELLFANDGFYEMYGYTKEQYEAECSSPLDMLYPDDYDTTMETVTKIVQEHGNAEYEYRVIKRDGSIAWTQCRNSFISIPGVGEYVLLAVTIDITKLREAEQKQHEDASKMQLVLDNVSSAIFVSSINGNEVTNHFSNAKYLEMLGYTEAEYAEKFKDSYGPMYSQDRARVIKEIAKTIKSGKEGRFDYRIIRGDGEIRWLRHRMISTSIPGFPGKVQFSVMDDITESKEADAQLRFLNESAHDILVQPDSELAINETLRKLLDYFAGDRAYVFEFIGDSQISNNTYEVCADGITSEMQNLQNVTTNVTHTWLDSFGKNEPVIISDVNTLDDAEMRKVLLAQDIRSLIVVPLWRDGKLIGYTGADNPKQAVDQVQQLQAISEYLAVLLTRRDLINRIEREQAAMRMMMNDTPGGFCLMKIDPPAAPSLEYANEGLCKMLGRTNEEMLEVYGSNAYGFLDLRDMQKLTEDSAGSLQNSGEFRTRCRLIRKDGTYLWTEVFGRFTVTDDGQMFLNSYFSDITEKMSEEEKEKELLDNLPFGAALYEFNGKELKVIHLNRRYWQLVGRSASDEKNIVVQNAVYPEDRAIIMQELNLAIREGRNAECDVRILYGENEYRPFHITAAAVSNGSSGYLIYVAYAPVAMDAVSYQEMLPLALSAIMAATPDMTYVKDRDLRYISASPTAASATGFSSVADMLGKTDYEIFGKTLGGKFATDDRRVLETGEPIVNDHDIIPDPANPNGSGRYALSSKFPLLDGSGKAIGVYGVSKDITEQREKESQLKTYTDNMPGGMVSYEYVDGKLHMRYASEGCWRALGLTREEYMDCTAHDPMALVHKDDQAAIAKMIQGQIEGRNEGGVAECDCRFRLSDGNYRWYTIKGRISDVTEHGLVLNATILDIDNAKRLQAELDEQQKELSALIATTPGGIFKYSADTDEFSYISDTMYTALGYTPKEFKRKFHNHFSEMIWHEDRAAALQKIGSDIAQTGDKDECEYRIEKKNGELMWVLDKGRLITDSDGKRWYVVVILNISRIKKLENDLKSEQARLEKIIDAIPGGFAIFRVDKGGVKRIYLSESASQTLGYKANDETNKDITLERVHPDDLEALKAAMAEAISGRKPFEFAHRLITAENKEIWINLTARPVVLDGVLYYYGLYSDVTEKLEAAERLRQSEEEKRLALAHSGNTVGRFLIKERMMTMESESAVDLGISKDETDFPEGPIRKGLVSPGTQAAFTKFFEEIISGEKSSGMCTYQYKMSNGWRWVEVRYSTVYSDSSEPVSAVVSFRDVSDQMEKEIIYKRWQQSLGSRSPETYTFFRSNVSKNTVFDSVEGTLLQADFPDTLTTFDEQVAYYTAHLVHPDDREWYLNLLNSEAQLARYYRGKKSNVFEYRELTADGFRWIKCTTELAEYPNSTDVQSYLLYEDIDDAKRTEIIMENRAETDPLTGILNRAAFSEKVDAAVHASEAGTQHALLMLDIDNFKLINDTFGHGAGDQALIEVSESLRSVLRQSDFVARLGGDEFMMFLVDIPDSEIAAERAKRICELIHKYYSAEVEVSASIGIAVCPKDGETFV